MGKANVNSALRKSGTLISKENSFLYQQVIAYEVSGSDKDHLQDHLQTCSQTDARNPSATQMSEP